MLLLKYGTISRHEETTPAGRIKTNTRDLLSESWIKIEMDRTVTAAMDGGIRK